MRALLTVVAFVVAIGAALLVYVHIDRLGRFTAAASTGRTAIWIDTPHVSAGDAIVLRAEVTGGKRAAIANVTVRDGERTIDIRGNGRDWGSSFTSSSRQQGSDELELALAVPADARAGSKLHLAIEVSWIIAESSGAGRFDDRQGVDVTTLEVPVLDARWCVVRRAASAAFAFGLLGVVCVLALFVPRLLRRLDRYEAQLAGTESALGILLILVGMAYLFAGHAWFARPLVAATRLTGTWFVVLAVLVWAVLPAYVASKLRKRVAGAHERTRIGLRTVAVPEGDPYRDNALAADAERTAEPRTLADVLEAIRSAGLTPVARRSGFVLEGATGTLRVRVRDVQRVVPQQLRIDASEVELNLDLALALVPLFGPMVAEIGIAGWILVDGKRDRAQLGAEVSERCRQVAAQLLEALRATQPMMDELQRRLGR